MKNTLTAGVEEAEKELDMNITTGLDFDTRLDRLANQQFNGYTLPDGKKWVGLRGVAQALQNKVYNRVKDGFENREMTDTIIDDVQDILGGVKRSRAQAIVRSESTRMVNEGKLAAYQESGVEGFKEWVSLPDDRRTEICRHLEGQVRRLNEPFTGPNGEELMIPPAHPNCRSFIRFVRE